MGLLERTHLISTLCIIPADMEFLFRIVHVMRSHYLPHNGCTVWNWIAENPLVEWTSIHPEELWRLLSQMATSIWKKLAPGSHGLTKSIETGQRFSWIYQDTLYAISSLAVWAGDRGTHYSAIAILTGLAFRAGKRSLTYAYTSA